MAKVTPYVLYEDADAAIAWLTQVLGFVERERVIASNGRTTHAELVFDEDGIVMLGAPGERYENPRHRGGPTQHVYVSMRGIDAHHARAVTAGACVIEAPADQAYGHRRYAVEDPEGHRWYFAEDIGVTA